MFCGGGELCEREKVAAWIQHADLVRAAKGGPYRHDDFHLAHGGDNGIQVLDLDV